MGPSEKLNYMVACSRVRMTTICQLTDNTFYRDVKSIFGSAFLKTGYTRANIIRAWKYRDPKYSFGICDTNTNTMIGFVLMTSSSRDTLYLSYIAIADSHRGAGIGTRFMKSILRLAVKSNKTITVIPLLPVTAWYESLGFKESGFRHMYNFHLHGTRLHMKYIPRTTILSPPPKGVVYQIYGSSKHVS